MLTPGRFRDLVSGRRRGPAGAALRGLLRIAETPYAWAMQWRNRQYDGGKWEVVRVEVPVVSVGNLTLGGTGKTPMVAWLARWFGERGLRVAIVSRGYGARDGARNDEAIELEERLPDVPHLQNPDRVAAARVAIDELDTQLILLDDALQHRRIARDVNLVLLDASEPFGFDHVFPRGTLREPLSGLARADAVLLSRADMLEESARRDIEYVVRQHRPDAVWAEIAYAPQTLINSAGEKLPLESLEGKRVAAFCGIGNPDGFRHTLQVCGYEVRTLREFPDHHDYTQGDIEALARWADSLECEAILCTRKDLVKIGVNQLGHRPLWAVSIGVSFLSGRERLERLLEPLVEQVQV